MKKRLTLCTLFIITSCFLFSAIKEARARSLEELSNTIFNDEGRSVIDKVFTGSFDFSLNNFDEDYTDRIGAAVKSGGNLADTLFRSADLRGADMTNREKLKKHFKNNEVPTEDHFKELINTSTNADDDAKSGGSPGSSSQPQW